MAVLKYKLNGIEHVLVGDKDVIDIDPVETLEGDVWIDTGENPTGEAIDNIYGVSFGHEQVLNSAQKTIACNNIGAAAVPTYTEFTLLASRWTDKTYSLETVFPYSTCEITMSISAEANEDEVDAYAAALLTGKIDENVVVALGDVPEINIPVYIQVMGVNR